MKASTIAVFALLIAQAGSPALALGDWQIDSRHAVAQFSIRHMMVANVRGTFTGITGSANFDGKKVKGLAVDATIDAKTVNTGEEKRDEHLRGAEFFDVAKYPSITFKSKKAVESGKGSFKLKGDLTMHGITREVELSVEGPTAVVKDPWGNERVGATATTKVNRKDFGIEYNKLLEAGGAVIGDDVNITLDIELVKAKPTATESAGKKSG